MKKKVFTIILVSTFVGSLAGHLIGYYIWPPKSEHVCQCESCKTIRQLEAIEVIDSIVKERIVINIGRED